MRVSSLANPGILLDSERSTTTSEYYYTDCLQLAHYTRMLQACGLHPGNGSLIGAILGKSLVTLAGVDPELVFVWHDLAAPARYTFSRSRGKVRRSLLECYDHEHDFRVRVATTARRITGSGDDPEPLVEPIGPERLDTFRHRMQKHLEPADPEEYDPGDGLGRPALLFQRKADDE
jgi:hypothetical protein